MGVSPTLAFTQVDAPNLAPFYLDTCSVSGFGEGIQAPLRWTCFVAGLQRFRIPLQLPGRRLLYQGENSAALQLGQTGLTSCSFSHPQAVDPLRIEAVQMDAYRSRMARKRDSNLSRRLASPAFDDHLGMQRANQQGHGDFRPICAPGALPVPPVLLGLAGVWALF